MRKDTMARIAAVLTVVLLVALAVSTVFVVVRYKNTLASKAVKEFAGDNLRNDFDVF